MKGKQFPERESCDRRLKTEGPCPFPITYFVLVVLLFSVVVAAAGGSSSVVGKQFNTIFD